MALFFYDHAEQQRSCKTGVSNIRIPLAGPLNQPITAVSCIRQPITEAEIILLTEVAGAIALS
jgi:hypothetical protein